MPNRFKKVYLWTLPKGAEHDKMEPYLDVGHIVLPKSMDAKELNTHLTSMADELKVDLFFAFRKNGSIWRIYKSGETDETEFNNLFSTTD